MGCPHNNFREMETGIHTDFADDMSYGDYLKLDKILSAQTLYLHNMMKCCLSLFINPVSYG